MHFNVTDEKTYFNVTLLCHKCSQNSICRLHVSLCNCHFKLGSYLMGQSNMERNNEIIFLKLSARQRRKFLNSAVIRTTFLIIIGEIYRIFCFVFVPQISCRIESSNFIVTNERPILCHTSMSQMKKPILMSHFNVTNEKAYFNVTLQCHK